MLGVTIVVELCEGCEGAEMISGIFCGVVNPIMFHLNQYSLENSDMFVYQE